MVRVISRRCQERGAASERGAILVMVVGAWIVLAGMGALVVDLGVARQRRSDAQTASDAAVLAAMFDLAAGDETTAETQAFDYVVENGFLASEATVNIPPASGPWLGDSDCVEVIVQDSSASLFGNVFGVSALDVAARTVGCITPSPPGVPAVHADSPNCSDKNLKFNGSDIDITGGVNSNDDVDVSGSDNSFETGEFKYTGSFSNGGSGNFYEGGVVQAGVRPMPIDFDINDYRPGGSEAIAAASLGQYHNAGNDKIDMGWLDSNTSYSSSSGALEPGLYYTTDDIDLSASDLHGAGGSGVTFVSASGQIKLSGSDHDLVPYSGSLLIFSDYRKSSPTSSSDNCDSGAVDISGSNSDWGGIVYAPRGQVKLAGSSNTTLSGAVLALTVEVSGSDLAIDATALTTASAGPRKLVE